MRRFLIPLLLLLALVGAACGSDADDGAAAGSSTTSPPDTTEGQAGGDQPPADGPQAIVSLSPTATEMLFAIGAGDNVVAVDAFSYYPPEAPVTDLSGFDPNLEAIAGFEPDLVVLSDPTIVDQLDGLGIDSLVQPAAATFDDVYSQIEQLGAATGQVAEAAALVAQMQADIDTIVAETPNTDVPLTYYHELDPTLFSVTSDTFIGEVYGLFGLENMADAVGDGNTYPQLTEEFLLETDPDLIFLADTLCCQQTLDTVAERPGWASLAAVQNGNVVELDDDIVSRWGPRVVIFVQDIADALALVPAAA